MKWMFVLLLVTGLAIPLDAYAQFAPVHVTVQRTAKKMSTQGAVKSSGHTTYYSPNASAASASLCITLRNTSSGPIDNCVVKWGIVKKQVFGGTRGVEVAYGKEEACPLKPQETKVIETDTVTADSITQQIAQRTYGEKIQGHGVQVLIGGRVVWEEFMPPTVKNCFDKLKPVGSHEEPAGPADGKKTKRK